MKQTIIIIALILLLGGFIIYKTSLPDSTDNSPAGDLTYQENFFDFGTIPMNGGNVEHEFILDNKSPNPVVIEKVITSCMCTTAFLKIGSGEEIGPFGMAGHNVLQKTNLEIMPGEKLMVRAIFDPAAHGPSGTGLMQRAIYLETNSGQSPKIELDIRAMVNL